MRARDLMTAPCPILRPKASCDEARRALLTVPGATLLPVMAHRMLVGVVHAVDVATADTGTVGDLLRPIVGRAEPDDDLHAVHAAFVDGGYYDVPVIDGREFMGLITATAILRGLSADAAATAEPPSAAEPAPAPTAEPPRTPTAERPTAPARASAATPVSPTAAVPSPASKAASGPEALYGRQVHIPTRGTDEVTYADRDAGKPRPPLPVVRPQNIRTPQPRPDDTAPPPPSDRTVVLVVQAERQQRQLAVMIVEQAGFLAIEAARLAQARAALDAEADHIGFVLLDDRLPDGTGVQLCGEISGGRWPDATNVPVALVTDEDDSASLEDGFFAGSTQQLSKPIDPDLLERMLRAHLSAA